MDIVRCHAHPRIVVQMGDTLIPCWQCAADAAVDVVDGPTPCECVPHCRNRSVPHEPRERVPIILGQCRDAVIRLPAEDGSDPGFRYNHWSEVSAQEAEEACMRLADGVIRPFLAMLGLEQTGYVVSVKLDFTDPPGVYMASGSRHVPGKIVPLEDAKRGGFSDADMTAVTEAVIAAEKPGSDLTCICGHKTSRHHFVTQFGEVRVPCYDCGCNNFDEPPF